MGRRRLYQNAEERRAMMKIYTARFKEKSMLIERKRAIIKTIRCLIRITQSDVDETIDGA